MIPAADLYALLDRLVGDRLRSDPSVLLVWLGGALKEPHVTVDLEDLDPLHVATLARIAAGEEYDAKPPRRTTVRNVP